MTVSRMIARPRGMAICDNCALTMGAITQSRRGVCMALFLRGPGSAMLSQIAQNGMAGMRRRAHRAPGSRSLALQVRAMPTRATRRDTKTLLKRRSSRKRVPSAGKGEASSGQRRLVALEPLNEVQRSVSSEQVWAPSLSRLGGRDERVRC